MKKKKKRNIELKNFDGVLFSRVKSQEEEKLGTEICETTVCRLNMEPTTFEIIIIQFGLKMPCFSWSFLGAFYSSPKSNCCCSYLLSKILWRIRLLPVYRPVLLLFVLCKWTSHSQLITCSKYNNKRGAAGLGRPRQSFRSSIEYSSVRPPND